MLVNVHPCSCFIYRKMAVMHKGSRLYKTRNCYAYACQKFLYTCSVVYGHVSTIVDSSMHRDSLFNDSESILSLVFNQMCEMTLSLL